jgi:hypothetical protein
MENLGSVTDEMNKHIAFIYNSKNGIESYNDEINGTMDIALRTMAEGQAQSIPVQQMKVQVFKMNGWTYKEFDPQQNKMVTWEGEKAPGFVSTLFSQATKAETLFGDLSQFQTWGEMLKRCKSVDDLATLKKVQQKGHKALKKVKNEKQSWIDWYIGEIEKLNARVERDS